jgi:hypothetical protein
MTNPEAIVQLVRLAGRDEILRGLGLEGQDVPASLDSQQTARLQALIEARLDAISRGLLEEAMASDDVHDTPSAHAYLDDRLRFLGDLLSRAQLEALRQTLRRKVEAWG